MTIAPLPAGSEPLYERLAHHIGGKISKGELAPGERLPTLRALAVEIGTTVGTVGRAYDLLAKRGFVDAAVGRGTFVKDADPAPPNTVVEPELIRPDLAVIERRLAEIADHLAAIRTLLKNASAV